MMRAVPFADHRALSALLAFVVATGATAGASAQSPPPSTTQPFTLSLTQLSTEPATEPLTKPTTKPSLFRDETDGAFDVSNFLSTRVGFLPIAMPITEPAVGYGLSLGLAFFHDKPQAVNYPGQPPRVIMPSNTMAFGAGTENGTWAMGLGHIGVWNDGKIRYVGAVGYADLELDWFGRGDSLGGKSISYSNDVL